jgi:hypothetical protein
MIRILLGFVCCLALAACSEQKSAAPAGNSDATTYIVRGEIISVPVAGDPGAELIIRHEAIPDFKNEAGEVVGMAPMGMPFTPAKGVSIDAFKPGDKVQFTWIVQWHPEMTEQLTKIEKLPDDTLLNMTPPTTRPARAMKVPTH